MTNATYKALFENNLELKNRHKAFLARLPTSPVLSSPKHSPLHTIISSDVQLPQSPNYYSDMSRPSSRASSCASPVPRHRRISVSPSDLVLLSEENAQLLEKLEKLEAESVHADQAGRKKLRILEKEIQGLREELEKTRARSDEFEAKAKAASMDAALRNEELSRKRQEREERIRALRGKSVNDTEDSDIRDFAPGNVATPMRLNPKHQSRRHVSEATFQPSYSDDDVPVLSRKGRHALKRSISQPGFLHVPSGMESPTEYALVSQLLLKIKELEETNTQIMEQQEKTTAQLQSVHKDADSIRLAYESLGDAESAQWTSEGEDSDQLSEQEGMEETVRFSSVRSLSEAASIAFSGVMEVSVQSSLRQGTIGDCSPVVSRTRARKSVVGLFDPPSISPATTPGHHSTPSVHTLTIPGLPPVPFVPQPSRTSSRSPSPTSRESVSGMISPTYEKTLSLPTLDCELGAVFDGTWQGTTGSHHFRSPSLVDLGVTGLHQLGSDDLVSPLMIGVPSLSTPAECNDVGSPTEAFTSAQQTSGLRPGTWRGDRTKTKYATAAERKRRQSETVRMRTNYWSQSRFGGTLLQFDVRQTMDASRPSTPIPQRLAHAFDAVVGTIGRSNSGNDGSSHEHEPPRDEAATAGEDTADSKSASVNTPQQQHRGIVTFVLELWLWLQFAIIIVLFVWAMAKRGPKSVLEGAGKRKVGPTS